MDDVMCERCSTPGHAVAKYMLNWTQAQTSLKANAQDFRPETSYMAMPCSNCNDPAREGWAQEDSSDDQFVFDQE